MNILCVCEFDNGGQMAALWKALNKYTSHKARLVTFRRTYLRYDEDVYDPPVDVLSDLVDWADFFVLGEVIEPDERGSLVYHKVHANNAIVRAGGSVARERPEYYVTGPLVDVMKTGAYHDSTLVSRIFPMAHTVNMYHFDEWPADYIRREGDPVKLVFSGTALKHSLGFSAPIMEAWKMLSSKYNSGQVEFVDIKGTSWEETLKIKSKCDICYDQTALGFYGSSSIEGMYYHMPTFCYIDGWCKHVHPDLPLINLRTGKEIFQKTVEFIEKPDDCLYIRQAGRHYVKNLHDASVAIDRWLSLIEYVSADYKPGV